VAVKSVDEALRRLEADRKLALQMLDRAGEKALDSKKVAAPWGGPEMVLGQSLMIGIEHINAHKAQLFFYLKLQGTAVNTHDFYGM
jgi:hypothetical protein